VVNSPKLHRDLLLYTDPDWRYARTELFNLFLDFICKHQHVIKFALALFYTVQYIGGPEKRGQGASRGARACFMTHRETKIKNRVFVCCHILYLFQFFKILFLTFWRPFWYSYTHSSTLMIRLIAGAWGGCALGLVFGYNFKDEIKNAAERLNASTKQSTISGPQLFLQKAIERSSLCTYAVLSTLNDEKIVSRAIQPFPVEYSHSGRPLIYFNTSIVSSKVKQMETKPDVVLTYLNCDKMDCISYSGKVHRVSHPESLSHWRDWMLAFYPEGPNPERGSRFSTWCLVPDTINLVSISQNIVSERPDSKSPEITYDETSQKWRITCTGKKD
jgi:general stress protein 26